MFSIKINNEYLPEGVKVKTGSVNLSYGQSGQRAVLNFTIIDTNLTGIPYIWSLFIGKKIELYEDGILKFGGQLDEPSTRKINNHPILEMKIICIDWHFITDKRYINQSYQRQLISQTFKDMIDEFLSEDGIWYSNDSIKETTGQYVSINCPYVLSTDAFDEMKNLINWQWKIGANKKFYLNEIDYDEVNPLIENESNYIPNSLYFSRNRDNIINTQIFKNVNALTDKLTQKATPTPDNDNNFFVRFEINQKPELYISADLVNPLITEMVDPREVGIGGLDSGLTYYWNKGSNIIQKDQNAGDIPAGKFLVVKYVGQYKIDIIEEDEDAINERKSIEGGSGIYANVENATEIEGIEVAEEKAQAIIERYKDIQNIIEFESYTINLEVGQVLDVNFPSFNLNSIGIANQYFLVIEKKVNDVGYLLRKKYTIVDGAPIGGWIAFFKSMLSPGKTWEIRPDAEVDISISEEETIDWSGEIIVSRYTPLFPLDDPGGLYPSNLLFPGTFIASNTYND